MTSVAENKPELKLFPELQFAVLAVKGTYAASFRIFRITGVDSNEVPCFEKWAEGATQAEDTEDIHEATAFAHGDVKWDGCSNWNIDENDRAMIHGCSKSDLTDIGAILGECWEMAKNGMVEKFNA